MYKKLLSQTDNEVECQNESRETKTDEDDPHERSRRLNVNELKSDLSPIIRAEKDQLERFPNCIKRKCNSAFRAGRALSSKTFFIGRFGMILTNRSTMKRRFFTSISACT